KIVAEGRAIPPERLEDVAHHYEAIGGRSPLGELTRLQAVRLRGMLDRMGDARPVYLGMREWHPFLPETLAEMRRRGHRCALGIILSSFQTEASWQRYVADVAAARRRVGDDAPEVVYAAPWADHPLFLETMADRSAMALAQVPTERRASTHLIFTAHSVPVTMAAGTPYASQFESAARRVAGRLGCPRWAGGCHGRGGSPRALGGTDRH